MPATNLTIDTLRFSLRIDSSVRGEVLLQRCSTLFHQRLRDDLARLARRLTGGGRTSTLQIERLVLDLGSFAWANGENELRERLLSQLEQRLRILLRGAPEETRERAEASDPSGLAAGPGSEAASGTRVEKPSPRAAAATEENHATDAKREARPATEPVTGLVTYLQYGVCLAPDSWLRQGPDDELIHALRLQPARWRPWLARLCLNPVALRRLRQTFRADTLHGVAQTLTGDRWSADLSDPTSAAHRQAIDTLPFSALHCFLQHPDMPLPPPEGDWPLPLSEAATLPWLHRLLLALAPQSPAIECWLPVLCHTPALRARLAQYLLACVPSQQEGEQHVRPRLRHRSLPDEDGLLPPGDAAALLRLQRALAEPGFGRSAIESGLSRLRHSPAWRARLARYLSARALPAIGEETPRGERNPAPADIGDGETVVASLPPLPAHLMIEKASRSLGHDGVEKRASLPSWSDDERLPVTNAGVVLLWPLLPGLFQQLGLTTEQRFVDVAAQHQAVGWLDSLIWGDAFFAEWRTPLNKLLCALPLEEPLPDWLPDPDRSARLNEWLNALPGRMPGLQRCGVIDLRQLFLQRPGTLTQQAGQWTVHVESDASDLLLRAIPWPRQQVLLPWCERPLLVDW